MLAVRKLAPGKGHIEAVSVPVPEPGPDQVLIRVAAAGVCGTDLHIEDGEFPSRPPVTLGHEVAGTVAAVGTAVEGIAPGLAVTSETYFQHCGRCAYCRSGRPNLCAERRSIGSAVDGGFAEYLVVPARIVHPLPEGVSPRAGALTEPLACTVRALLELGRIRAGDLVAIAGPGTMGLLALQLARASGARAAVFGTAGDVARLALAQSLGGAPLVADGEPAEVAAEVRQALGGEPDVAIDCSGAAAAMATLLQAVRRGGRYVQVGLAGRPLILDFDQVCYKELRVSGSNATVPSSWRTALALLAARRIEPEALVGETFGLAEWRSAFAAVRGRHPGKPLLVPDGGARTGSGAAPRRP